MSVIAICGRSSMYGRVLLENRARFSMVFQSPGANLPGPTSSVPQASSSFYKIIPGGP
jgi:hypothetical protein